MGIDAEKGVLCDSRSCAREIVGLPVVDISSGVALGVVKECIFDSGETRLLGLRVGESGPVKGGHVLRFRDIRSLGLDMVTVNDVGSLIPVDDSGYQWEGGSTEKVSVVGKRIITEDGRDMGTIKDVAVDALTAEIVGIEVSESIIQDILSGRNLIPWGSLLTVGEDAVVVPDGVEPPSARPST